ncbi:hypothetical protein RJ640_012397 [Escallonia rubra]|uniref:Dof zinc finger protein n=1 Tax=Escallonia rubra TaxID=112253 RepID=A0AA88RAN1_9ASTE|nr:hypothetical protein RJ640_012397 [Escallonia rubra]
MLVCSKAQQDKKPRPPDQQAQKCPRCDSTNTKFCYYNNYSLTQPRYFCKSCRRYWTKGGTLRNVPVGGGCRKNKRSSSSSRRSLEQPPHVTSHSNPLSDLSHVSYDSTDLSLAFARLQKQTSGYNLGFEDHDLSMLSNADGNLGNSIIPSNGGHGFLDAIRSGFLDTSSGYQNVYYGNLGNGEMGHNVENGGIGEEMALMPYEDHTTAVTMTTVKQEACNGGGGGGGREAGENRILWGFPWQLGGDYGNNMADVDSGRQSWNGLGNSTWHGLLNSPLM